MMRKTILVLAFELLAMSAVAQSLTIENCRKMAHDNYPAIKQYGMIELVRDYTMDNASKGWLPQLSVSAGGYAFTDILKGNEQMSKMGLDMKNYVASASVMIHQNVYDGGQINANKKVAEAQTAVQKNQLDVTLYGINERVEQIFFGILMLDEQILQNGLLQNDLVTSEKTVSSMMQNGLANQSDLDVIKVEQIKALQQKDALCSSRKSYVKMLGTFIGKELDENTVLVKPNAVIPRNLWQPSARPEILFYSSQNDLIDAQRKQLDAKLRPTVSLFGAGLIHTDVTSVMNSGLLIGGVSLSWNIGALYTRKNDIKKLEIQKSINDNMRDVFLFNNRLQNEEANGTIESLHRVIEQDEEIVKLRESIRDKSYKKIEAGTESVNDLVSYVNAVSMARVQKALHEVQLIKEEYRLRNINNEQ